MHTSFFVAAPLLFTASVTAQYLVTDINPGAPDSAPASLTVVDRTLFFSADDGVNGRELWRSDGTSVLTLMVADLNPGASGSNPTNLVALGNTLFFNADDGVHGLELWRSDGSAAGTSLVTDIWPGVNGSNPQYLTVIEDTLYFVANDGTNDYELWKSDGTAAGTVLVADIWPGPSGSGAQSLTAVGSTLYLVANDGVAGYELWISDGTPTGTVMIADINPGPSGSSPRQLTAVGNALFLAADDGINGSELWRSDGTSTGTQLLASIRGGVAGSDPDNLTAAAGMLFFAAHNGLNGEELWKSDGTTTGTVMVADIQPGSVNSSSTPSSMIMIGSTLFFTAHNGSFGGNGRELWRCDSPWNQATTSMVLDTRPGSASGIQAGRNRLMAAGDNTRILLAAEPGGIGIELWRSDGTAAGTALQMDINAGGGDSDPNNFARLGGTVFFRAGDGVNGVELWAMHLGAVGGALREPYGRGCPGTGGLEPRIAGVNLPVVGNAAFAVQLTQALPTTVTALFGGWVPGNVPLGGGCTYWLAVPSTLTLITVTDGTGTATLPMPLPNWSTLVGLEIFFQWGVIDPNGALGNAASFSSGMLAVVGS